MQPNAPIRRRRVKLTRILLVIDLVVCVIALAAIPAADIRSVLATGPALFICGLLTIFFALSAKYRNATILGLSHVGICLLFVTLVNVLNWSPDRATAPFLWMGSMFTAGASAVTVYVLRHPPKTSQPWVCRRCEYLLYGLPEPRCPECGLAFNPAEFAGRLPRQD